MQGTQRVIISIALLLTIPSSFAAHTLKDFILSPSAELNKKADYILGVACTIYLRQEILNPTKRWPGLNLQNFLKRDGHVSNLKSFAQDENRNTELEWIKKNLLFINGPYYTFFHYTKVQSRKDLYDRFFPFDSQIENANRDKVHQILNKPLVEDSDGKKIPGAYASISQYLKRDRTKDIGYESSDDDEIYPSSGNDPLVRAKGVLYVASSPLSSANEGNVGNLQLSFTFHPEKSHILDLSVPGRSKVFGLIKDEVKRRHSRTELLNHCDFENKNLMLMVLEESNIDLVRYHQDFYQLIHLKNVINSDALEIRADISTKPGLTDQDKEHIKYKMKERASSRIYSLSH